MKAQSSYMYTSFGILIATVFSVFLFVSQSGEEAENIRAQIATQQSLSSENFLRSLNYRTMPLRQDSIPITTAVGYACSYGGSESNYRYTLSTSVPVRANPIDYLNRTLNESLNPGYQLRVICNGGEEKSMLFGSQVPSSTKTVFSSTMEFPSADGNRSQMILRRW
jgi:hypothetical protein